MVRAPITQFMQASQKFLFWRHEATQAEARKTEARDYLKDYITDNAEPDENGTKRLYFETPYAIGPDKFTGLELRRSQPRDRIDTDAARAYVDEHHLNDRVVKMIPVWDWDELAVLNQQGIIPDADLDALFITPDPTYSLYAIEE